MKRVVKVMVVLAVVLLNAAAIVPNLFHKKVRQKEACVLQQPTIQITEVTPVIIPSLFKIS
ncbi:MAG TPA: hypothetical protein VM884_08145 [Flavisolibacter sp.]|jgi:type II secretory pathway pseudopilin PulG|nr:hypothetical protein [Flavisolibacter sp.]